jgi:hypothetical protein
MRRAYVTAAALLFIFCLSLRAASAQTDPQPAPPPPPTHDISKVDHAPLGGVIAIPFPEQEKKRLKKYEIPELAGAQQALGSQLVDGELPRPLVDYVVRSGGIDQRLSIFERGLVVLQMQGAGGTMLKKLILPPDGLASYLNSASPDALASLRRGDVAPPIADRRSLLRVYRKDRSHVELTFDPAGAVPKTLGDEIRPLEDLVRAMSEDRRVTNTVAGYEPKVGDELVSDDRKVWRVERIIEGSQMVQFHCIGQATIIYVAKKDLYNYFIGKPSTQ